MADQGGTRADSSAKISIVKSFWSSPLPNLALLLALAMVSSAAFPAESPTKPDEMAGAILYRDKGCARCHGADLSGTIKGPSLANIRDDKSWPPQKMTQQILNGGAKMPPFADALSDAEIGQIVSYLRAKHRPVPPPSADQGPSQGPK